MKNKKINMGIGTLIGILIILSILLSSSVFAFAVSRPSMLKDNEGNPQIFLLPGETRGITFVAQNGAGATSDITIQANIIEGLEIIEITDSSDIHTIPPEGRINVNSIITIPENAQIGDVYGVVLTFSTVSTGAAGGFTFGSSIRQKFNVVIGEERAEEIPVEKVPQVVPGDEPTALPKTNLGIIMVIAVLIILIVIIYLIVRNRKRKKSQETVDISKN